MRVRGWSSGWTRLTVPMLVALCIGGCGGGGGGGDATPPPVVDPSGQTGNPLEQALADAALNVTDTETGNDLSEQSINKGTVSLQLGLLSSSWGDSPSDLKLSINGTVNPGYVAVAPDNGHHANALVNLEDGPNDVVITGSDESGRFLRFDKQLWGGSRTMTVRVQDAAGNAWTDGADITVTLADAPGVSAHYSLAAGSTTPVLVKNLPSRTVLVEASSGKLAGMIGAVVASNGEIVVKLQPGSAAGTPTAPIQNQTLDTAGQLAPQMLSNTFVTAKDTQAVTVRYHFKTSEWTAGQFGSHFSNDYYSVRLRNTQGQQAVESLAMNGLGDAAFDAEGKTASRTLRLTTNPDGDTVRLDGVVGNTFDGKNDSQLVIEQITEERSLVQPQLAWDTAQGGVTINVALQGDAALADALPVKLYWASGSSITQVLGAALKEFSLPKSSAGGSTASFHVAGNELGDAPALATHLLVVAGSLPTSASAALADVQLLEGPNADATSLSAAMRKLLKSSARQAGAATVSLAQTAFSPAQFAHAMFLNLVRGPATLASNITAQQAIYGAEGDAVIQVFVSQSQGLTQEQVIAKQPDIESAMAAEILRQGPAKVSTQCADPAQASVADVRVASVPAATASLFKALASSLAVTLSEASGLWHITAAP